MEVAGPGLVHHELQRVRNHRYRRHWLRNKIVVGWHSPRRGIPGFGWRCVPQSSASPGPIRVFSVYRRLICVESFLLCHIPRRCRAGRSPVWRRGLAMCRMVDGVLPLDRCAAAGARARRAHRTTTPARRIVHISRFAGAFRGAPPQRVTGATHGLPVRYAPHPRR
jgi:hypothetical protein